MSRIRAVLDESGRSPEGAVTIKADRLEIDIDTTSLARSLAQVGIDLIVDGIRQGGGPASPATIKRRRAQGITSTTKFHATGRLARELATRQVGDAEYEIQTPPGYFQDPALLDEFIKEIVDPLVRGRMTLEIDAKLDDFADEMAKVSNG